MTEANESYVVSELIDLGLTKEQIRGFLRKFGGWRFYIRKKKSEYEEIITIYEQMIKQGVSRAEAVKLLSELFEKSTSRIREITKKQERLFEV